MYILRNDKKSAKKRKKKSAKFFRFGQKKCPNSKYIFKYRILK